VTISPENQNTIHQKIWQSTPGKAIRENKELAAAGAVGVGITLGGACIVSPALRDISWYVLTPAAGTGLVALGIAGMDDARVNDWPKNKAVALGKLIPCTAATAAGCELIGQPLNVKILKNALEIFQYSDLMISVGLVYAGVTAGKISKDQALLALADPDNRVLLSLKASGAGAASVGCLLGATELVGTRFDVPIMKEALSSTIKAIAQSNTALGAGSTLLTTAALVSAKRTVKNIRQKGNEFVSAAYGVGSLTCGLGALETGGRTLGMESAKGLFAKNIDNLGALSMSAGGAAWSANAIGRIKQHGLCGRKALEVGFASASVPGGMAIATNKLAPKLSHFFEKSALTTMGGGMEYAAYGFARTAITAFRQRKYETSAFHGGMALLSMIGGLYTLGETHHIGLLQKSPRLIPMLCGAMITAGVAGILYDRAINKNHHHPNGNHLSFDNNDFDNNAFNDQRVDGNRSWNSRSQPHRRSIGRSSRNAFINPRQSRLRTPNRATPNTMNTGPMF